MGQKDGNRSIDDLRRMIMSFQISELRKLLGACGSSQYGRKHELLQRAGSLLQSAMQEKVKTKILELYHERVVGSAGAAPRCQDNTIVPTNPYSSGTSHLLNSGFDPYGGDRSLKDASKYKRQSRYQSRCSTVPPVTMDRPSVHTDVQFISLPFYELIDVLIKPTNLELRTLSGYHQTNLVFHLTPYQTHFITNSSTYYIKSVIERAVQIQLRFCVVETSSGQEDLYPTGCKIVVNGKGTTLPGQPPPTAQNQEPKKPHRPVNITSFCHLSPMKPNEIQLKWLPSASGQQYTATVHLVRTIQVDTLIQKLANKPLRSKENTLGFIKVKLSPDLESDIAMTSLKVSLCCPISRTRMSMPCRAKNCNHLQCFDGATYIQMNERKPSWVCPVCDQKAYYDDLFQDELFKSIITEENNTDDIVFFQNGSWRPLEDVQNEQESTDIQTEILSTPNSKNKPENVADSDSPPVLCIDSPEASETTEHRPPPVSNILPLNLSPLLQRELKSNTAEARTPMGFDDVEVIMIDDSDSDS